jgi:type IV secretion system pilin
MNKLKIGIISLFSILTLAGAMVPLTAATSFAQSTCPPGKSPAECLKIGVGDAGGTADAKQGSLGARIKTVVNVILYFLGAIAVFMIVLGGIRYTTSNGDPSGIKGAKDTIIYAVVGLVVAIMAYAIVNFVLDAFIK